MEKYNYNDEGTQDVEVRETEISKVIMKLAQTAESVAKEFHHIEERIGPVLRGGTPKDMVEKSPTPEFSSALAQDINNWVRKLDSLQDHMRSIRNRIEL